MIIQGIINLMSSVMFGIVGFLPPVDEATSNLIAIAFNYPVQKFIMLSYYYLPVDTMVTCASIYLAVTFGWFSMIVLLKTVSFLTGNIVNPDKLIVLK